MLCHHNINVGPGLKHCGLPVRTDAVVINCKPSLRVLARVSRSLAQDRPVGLRRPMAHVAALSL